MAEAAALVVLHLLCLNLALGSWPCSLPHQSSPTSPITTFAPGQLLSPCFHVSCPRTSTTSSSHIPHQLLSLPPSAHRDCINAPDWTQLTLSRTSWVWFHRLPVLAELMNSGLLLHLTWVCALQDGKHKARESKNSFQVVTSTVLWVVS